MQLSNDPLLDEEFQRYIDVLRHLNAAPPDRLRNRLAHAYRQLLDRHSRKGQLMYGWDPTELAKAQPTGPPRDLQSVLTEMELAASLPSKHPKLARMRGEEREHLERIR